MNYEFLKNNNISSLVDLLRHRAKTQPDKTAYIFLTKDEGKEVKLTYEELDKQAKAIAAKLQKKFAPGERALLLYPPSLEFISAFFGCLYAGVVSVPCYPPDPNRLAISMAKLQGIIADCEPEIILTTKEFLDLSAFIFPDYPKLEKMNWLATDNIDASLINDWRFLETNENSLAFLQYTSGSTGAPKGVMVSHKNILCNEEMIRQSFAHDDNTVTVNWLPLFHDMGLIGNVLQPLYLGVVSVLMSPVAFLKKPLEWLRAITRHKGTTVGGPNFGYDLCARKATKEELRRLDLSSVKVAYNGAEPIQPESLKKFAETFETCGFRQESFYPCYGMAEATLFISGGLQSEAPVIEHIDKEAFRQNQVKSLDTIRENSLAVVGCGRTWLDSKIIVVDPETMTRRSDNQVGEIWFSGSTVARGYWKKPELSKKTFQACLSDTGEGPFLRTGDLGFIKDGELFVAGRLKDVIIIRGQNHYPQDIEFTVEQCHKSLRPGCGAAFSVEAEKEEKLVVLQEVKKNHLRNLDIEKTTKVIIESIFTKHELRPWAVVLIEPGSIPKTSSGKIRRRACRDMFLEGSLLVVGEWRQDVHKSLDEAEALQNMDSLSEEEVDILLQLLDKN